MRSRFSLLLVLTPLATTLSCKDKDGDDVPAPMVVTTSLGQVSAADQDLAWPGVVLTPNLDDDDGDGIADYGQGRMAQGDDDFALISVLAPSGFELSLSDPDEVIRLSRDGEQFLTEDGGSKSVEGSSSPVEIQVEVGDYLAQGAMTFRDVGTGESFTLAITGAPLIVNNHTQPSELVMAVNFAYTGYSNSAMIQDYEDWLGDRFMRVSGSSYQDPWIQDEFEFATSMAPDSRLDIIVDSIRNGQGREGSGLDDLAEDEFFGPEWALGIWGTDENATSQDYFGNLEVIPPHTAHGVEYPFGRIYYGLAGGNWEPNDEIQAFWASQKVQAPFTLDVSWLCVGHVDEFLTTVPAAGSRLGWKLVYSDVDLAWEILEAQDPSTVLTRYAESNAKPWDTIGDMVADEDFRALNEELKQDYLLPNLQTLKDTLELTDEDILYIPALFEEVSMCGGTTAAAFPGMANLILADDEAGQTTLFVPDPYMRTDEADPTTDPIAMAFAAAMPPELQIVWLDDWQVYHLNLGEVHCGSNVVRTPDQTAWWESARHLLEAE